MAADPRIAALIPHAGRMVLWQRVVDWDAARIVLRAETGATYRAKLPDGNAPREFYTRKVSDNLYSVGMLLPLGELAPAASRTVEARLFAGPQQEKVLEALAPGLDLVKDYGWLTILSKPLFWLLDRLHGLLDLRVRGGRLVLERLPGARGTLQVEAQRRWSKGRRAKTSARWRRTWPACRPA